MLQIYTFCPRRPNLLPKTAPSYARKSTLYRWIHHDGTINPSWWLNESIMMDSSTHHYKILDTLRWISQLDTRNLATEHYDSHIKPATFVNSYRNSLHLFQCHIAENASSESLFIIFFAISLLDNAFSWIILGRIQELFITLCCHHNESGCKREEYIRI